MWKWNCSANWFCVCSYWNKIYLWTLINHRRNFETTEHTSFDSYRILNSVQWIHSSNSGHYDQRWVVKHHSSIKVDCDTWATSRWCSELRWKEVLTYGNHNWAWGWNNRYAGQLGMDNSIAERTAEWFVRTAAWNVIALYRWRWTQTNHVWTTSYS